MYSNDDLGAAVAAGVLREEDVASFRAFIERERKAATVDEEYVRLVSGFNDIFVAIAAALFLGALAAFAAPMLGRWAGGLAVAIAAWGLAEYFTRKRRMALPSILLVGAFVGGAAFAAGSLVVGGEMTLVAGTFAALAAAVLHWWRFRVPITVAACIAAVVGAVIATLLALDWLSPKGLLPVVFACGLATFALAIWWDSKDRARLTRRADVAFWLHLLSAPLLVHPVLTWLARGHEVTAASSAAVVLQQGQVFDALVVLLVYGALTLVSLAIDRRALMVSALTYVLYALGGMFEGFGSTSTSFAVAGVLIGSGLLMLSAFWHHGRRALVRRLPARWQGALPAI